MRPAALVLLLAGCATVPKPAVVAHWTALETEPYKGKQDDVVFVNPELGWYVNGAGRIFKTADGGAHWEKKLDKPGTYFRAIGFVDEKHGFAGNLGPDYFPGVTDDTPLYETFDGGETWGPAAGVPLPKGAGICAIDVVTDAFINAGHLDHRTVIHAVGRVGGPAKLLRSVDAGKTWRLIDLDPYGAMALDVKFFDASHGFVASASNREVEQSHALVLRTDDGGATWTQVYQSARPFENTWKLSFPTREVGYVTVQSYDEDPAKSARYVAKTVDGGAHWKELPLVSDAKQQEFGIAFVSPEIGWVGAMNGGFQTVDGGKTWTPVAMGRAVNKIRLVPAGDGFVGYAIGTGLFKLDARLKSTARPPPPGAAAAASE
jgi:photosystem II stability/assembly factor-like uncharacterized protein